VSSAFHSQFRYLKLYAEITDSAVSSACSEAVFVQSAVIFPQSAHNPTLTLSTLSQYLKQ